MPGFSWAAGFHLHFASCSSSFPSFLLSGVIPATPIWENRGKVTPVYENLFLHSSPLFIPRTFLCKKSGKVTPVSWNFHCVGYPWSFLLSMLLMIPLTLLCIIPGKWHHLQKFIQHADHRRRFLPALFNVQKQAFWKPLAGFFEIPFHEYQQPSISPWIMSASPSAVNCILTAASLCENRSKVERPSTVLL